jgi:hypothetical protein
MRRPAATRPSINYEPNIVMPAKLVLDTNCLIDLERNAQDAQHIRTLIGAWKDGRIELAVVAVSASENQRGGTASKTYNAFEAKLSSIGLSGVRQLLPLAIWDIFYWDHALWSTDEMEKLLSQIRSILFPGIPIAPPANVEENSVCRNHMCDVMVAWSCIHHEWTCLVTRDKNFHRHKRALASLGLHDVRHPADAADL